MPPRINLSHNELKYLLKTVFEGAFGHNRDIAAMADNISWLEASSLGGVNTVLSALERLDGNMPAPRLSELQDGHWEVDGGGAPLIVHLDGLCDFMRDQAGRHGVARLNVLNYSETDVLIAATRCAKHGFNVQARCPFGIARIVSEHSHPDIFRAAEGEPPSLVFSVKAEPLPDLPASKKRILGADKLRGDFENSIRDGIDVSMKDYEVFTKYAARVLVPTSEASRSGAGE